MAEPAKPDFALQDTIYRLLQERPDLRRNLAEMVEWEHLNPPKGDVRYGFQWQEVHTPVSIINQLIAKGIIDLISKTNSTTEYGLRSASDTTEALEAEESRPAPQADLIDVRSLFKLVIGHEKAKALLSLAVQANDAVHCLLMGPPGTAKTLMLHDIGHLPGAYFYVGATMSKSGLVSFLIYEHPRFLVIDELDQMAEKDMPPLLHLMENGLAVRLIHGHNETVHLDTKVFAGANDLRRIPAAILSRFAKFEIPPYTAAEFVRVAQAVLVQREGLGQQMAALIAGEVVAHSTDIRDAVRVARMSRGDPKLVLEIVGCLWPKGARSQISPMVARR